MESDNNKDPVVGQNENFLEFLNTLNLFEYHEYLVKGMIENE